MTLASPVPTMDIDIFDDEVILDRYPTYQKLRDAGPAVYIQPHNIWAMGRYADIRAASLDVENFSSARGVEMLEELANMGTVGTILGSDPPKHDILRSILSEKLAPRALRTLRGFVQERADAVVAGVHCDLDLVGLDDMGWKAIVANVSDIAAVGGRPAYAVVTVAGPLGSIDFDLLYDGLIAASVAYECPIVGGDLSSSVTLMVSVAMVGDGGGSTPPPVLRSGAGPGGAGRPPLLHPRRRAGDLPRRSRPPAHHPARGRNRRPHRRRRRAGRARQGEGARNRLV